MKIKPDLKRGVKPKDFRKILTCTVCSFLILTLAVSPVFADISTADPGQVNSTVEETEEAKNPAAAEKGNFGKIEIITIPNGSEIHIKEKVVGKTPALIEKVPPGFYEVVLTQEGYEDVFERVLVKAGKTASISKKLRVNERVHSISSSPSGANVYLDGKYKGITPVVFHADEGQHKLTIKKTGYSTVSEEINASGETALVMEEKLHLNLFTYFAATLVLLVAGVIIKRNPEKLKFKFPRKVSAGDKALKKVQKAPEKRDEKLQGNSSVPDDLVELENFTEQNFEYTVKKKKKV
ncbi:PEGA domain-containing protein [Methanosarcina sp. 2.H.T.1A.8]|uniref:PEGA domain-containing protein n=1 Tax=Methanosarcina sp. 2.H.T.1A.8 TaxID=1483598 RepID=UPI003183AFD9